MATPTLPEPLLEWQDSLPTVSKLTRIAVLCGGLSSEREVSLRSGNNCLAALHRLGYVNTVLLDVDRDIPFQLRELEIELAFLALHGEMGEDGAIQGVLEYLGIPYTGNRLTASAATMNKAITKQILAQEGLPVLGSLTLSWPLTDEVEKTLQSQVQSEIGYPLMVKPLGLGSSVGMSKVESPEQLLPALEAAGHCEPSIMLEPFVHGRDFTVGVIHVAGVPTVTPILELRIKDGWYDFEAKYTPGRTEFLLPAPLPAETTQAIQAMALKAHAALGCHGVSRTDFVYDETSGMYHILEVNSIPGMTDLSDLPAQCKAMGVSYDELVNHLLQTAVQTPEWCRSRSRQLTQGAVLA